MAHPASLINQLELLGVHLPSWPEEEKERKPTPEWVDIGKAYAEGVCIWRAKLRNAPQGTKAVVGNLISHRLESGGSCPWDQWVSTAIYPDIAETFILDRWQECVEELKSAQLTCAQLFGASLALAEAEQIAGANHGMKRLLQSNPVTGEEALAACTQMVASANTNWRESEAKHSYESWQKYMLMNQEWITLIRAATNWSNEGDNEEKIRLRNEAIQSLERSISILQDDEKWTSLPRTKARDLIRKNQQNSAMELMIESLPTNLPDEKKEAYGRLITSLLLSNEGKWQEAVALHERSVRQIQQCSASMNKQIAQMEIIKTETELLSHELSIALQAGALSSTGGTAQSEIKQQGKEGKSLWKSLSRSQLGQDLWVLEKLNWRKGGFFVEFGATDGVLLSNSWLLEKHFAWRGICAEPNPKFFEQLKRNRSCQLSPACVSRVSGEKMQFVLADAFGGLLEYARKDEHHAKRAAYEDVGETIEVETISLTDLLFQHNAPKIIDYLSIDTEGSELAVLEGIDWNCHQFRCVTIEHNFTEQREAIMEVMLRQGYQRVEAKWDDWYFKEIE